MAWKVAWAESAVRDLEELAAYLASESPRAAGALLDRVEARARSLAESPTRGRRVPELQALGLGSWRELIVKPWRIVYQVSGRQVLVVAVLGRRRDAASLLQARALRRP